MLLPVLEGVHSKYGSTELHHTALRCTTVRCAALHDTVSHLEPVGPRVRDVRQVVREVHERLQEHEGAVRKAAVKQDKTG
jgi:hypothetical protein